LQRIVSPSIVAFMSDHDHQTISAETEAVSPRFADLDTWPAGDIVASLVEAQIAAASALCAVRPALAAAAEAAADRLTDGTGRLVYAGAGASGRLAAQDAVELHPTYGWPAARLILLLAGGEVALARSVEGAEDDAAAARAAVAEHDLGPSDAMVSLAASGRTPYVVAAAQAARDRGALVIGLANNPDTALLAAADWPILLDTGPEVIAGSTRMAAGTAQKAALNVLSTTIMVRLGRVYSNLMADLAASNAKLDRRRIEVLRRIRPADEPAARAALDRAGGGIKAAALILAGLAPDAANRLLDRHGGSLRAALGEVEAPRRTIKTRARPTIVRRT